MTSDPKTVGGRYELGDLLGRGGMAEVRYAVDRRLGRPVAVKQLRTDLATDPTFQARFRREAQSAAGLNHPTIVAVYDTGEEPDSRTGVSIPYIVMELVEGQTLRDLLRDGRKIMPERALELTQGVLDALSYSHKAGIIHRDIKPANVMLTPSGGVKVMDFGIARAVADTSATMTQTAAVIGTAQYLSPEQARGETVDSRSDIYSAGCLLYELLVGRPPFVGDSPVSVAYQHVRELPVPPSQLDPAISPDIDAITLKALAKDPGHRYQSAAEMKSDITRVLAGGQATAVVPRVTDQDPQATRVVPAVPAVVPGFPDTAVTATQNYQEPRKSRAGFAVFLTIMVVALLAAGGYGLYYLLGQSNPSTTVEQVAVPSVIGFNKASAESTIRNAQLVPEFKNVNGRDDETVNTAVDQSPRGNTQVAPNSTVTVEINVGPRTAKVPDGLVGENVDDARETLESSGFTVRVADAGSESADAEKGQVLAVQPGEGKEAPVGSEVVLRVATGLSTVPNFIGSSRERAEADAKAAGFSTPSFVEKASSEPAGTVIAQDPEPGEKVERDQEIRLTVAVAQGAAPTEPAPTTTAPEDGDEEGDRAPAERDEKEKDKGNQKP